MNLIFDVDDTLYDLMQPFERVFTECGYHQKADCMDVFLASRRIGDEMYDEMEQGRMDSDRYFILRTQKALETAGIHISDDEAMDFKKKYRDYQKEISMTDTMKEILDISKEKGWKLGIISNGMTIGQWEKIKTIGVLRWISKDMVIVSGDIKIAKPDIRIYEKAQEKFHISPEDTVYVGDTYKNDIVGAGEAGWKTIWMNKRNYKIPEGGRKPDYEVTTEQELKDLIISL
ncbi:MAG: HAD family hydrolase [Anaerostipes sp.]|nr:HAD family hydrolase [Anaerostipes sp.]